VQLELEDETHFQTYWFGTRFEEPTGAILQGWWDGTSHFFDIGSNYGFFSLWAASLHRGLEIHAFEPNPKTFERLDKFAQANGFDNITRNSIALSDCDTSFAFCLEECNTGSSHHVPGPGVEEDKNVIRVRATTFDQYAADLKLQPLSSVAKIDVEGMELHVLRGMAQALDRKIFRGLCLELLEEHLAREGTSVAEVESFLRQHGYRARDAATAGGRQVRRPHHNGFYEPV
jgi:FkbM family methyltransferase